MQDIQFQVGRIYNVTEKDSSLSDFDLTFRVVALEKGFITVDYLFSNAHKPIGQMEHTERYLLSNFVEGTCIYKDVTDLPNEWVMQNRISDLNEIIEKCGLWRVEVTFQDNIPNCWNIHIYDNGTQKLYYNDFAVMTEKCKHFGEHLTLVCSSLEEFKAQILSVCPNAHFRTKKEYENRFKND